MNPLHILPLIALSPACVGSGTRGDGHHTSAVRELAAFHAVEAHGALTVEITVGSPQRVEVFADTNLIPLIKTEVSSGTLTLSTDGSVSSDEPVRVVITTTALDALDASGATTVTLSGATGPRLHLEASGASTVRGSGDVTELVVDLSGASRAALEDLHADAVQIDASGACSAAVFARQTLDVEASGASHVTQRGPGHIRKIESSGASTVETASAAAE